jgi:DnaJ-class molecular chaperone
MNYYEVLGLTPEATSDEIKRAFRKKALKYHPDMNRSPDAATRFKEAYEAYRFLKDAAAKAEYDTQKYESQRFRARTKTKEDLEASSLDGYEKAFATDPTIVNNLEGLFDVVDELKDMDWATYEKEGRQKEKTLADYMRKMARDHT